MQQARAPQTRPFGPEAFAPTDQTVLRWLGMAGFLISSRGTTLMVDPLLGDFDMPLLVDLPLDAASVPHLDAVLVTHSDNDHYSVPTCRALAPVTDVFHSTRYVDTLFRGERFPSVGHAIGDRFRVGGVEVEVHAACCRPVYEWNVKWMQSGTVQAPSLAQDGSRIAASEG